MPLLISSPQNGRVKQIVKLNQRRQRDEQQLVPVEGIREIGQALAHGFIPHEAYICPELAIDPQAQQLCQQLQQLHQQGQTALFEVTADVFAKIAYRGESGGLLILLPYWQRPLADLPLSPIPFLLVVEGGEKPGNLGAIFRTADAAGVDAIIISQTEAGKGTDIFNPNAVRASLGALFTVPFATAPTPALMAWLRQKQILTAAATPAANTLYTAVNLQQPIALIMGSEADGLSQSWLQAADLQLKIPMQGQIDSLNLSVSAALLLYEVVRQRGAGLTLE